MPKYRELFNCNLQDCFYAVVFLEDWASGHYFETKAQALQIGAKVITFFGAVM